MENRDKILKKIENLLALAGNNPSENEAIAAACKAQELMAKYNIELAEVDGIDHSEEITEETYWPKPNSHYVRKWRHRLSNIVAKNFCCKTYTLGREATVFYGHKKDAQIAKEVFKFLFETGNKLATRYYNKCKKEGQETRGVLNAYLVGFCDGISDVLGKQCTALMIVTPKDVEDSYAEKSKNFKSFSSSVRIANDQRAIDQGREEGRSVASARALEG